MTDVSVEFRGKTRLRFSIGNEQLIINVLEWFKNKYDNDKYNISYDPHFDNITGANYITVQITLNTISENKSYLFETLNKFIENIYEYFQQIYDIKIKKVSIKKLFTYNITYVERKEYEIIEELHKIKNGIDNEMVKFNKLINGNKPKHIKYSDIFKD